MAGPDDDPPAPRRASGPRVGRDAATAAVVVLVLVVSVAPTLLDALTRRSGPARSAAAPTAEIKGAQATGRPAAANGATPAPSAAVQLGIAEQAILPWTDRFGVVHVEVIVGVRNAGSRPVQIVPESVPYSVQDTAGRAVLAGRFPVAIPATLAPGATGYLVDSVAAGLATQSELKRLSVHPVGRPGRTADRLLRVEGVGWSSGLDGMAAAGRVTNQTAAPASAVAVVVLARGSDRRLLGAVYDLADVTTLAPGASAGFRSSYPGAPPLPPAGIAASEAIAAVSSP